MIKTILVFGGAGFIGTNLCLSALAKGFRVVVFDNLSRRGTDVNLQTLQDRGGQSLEFVKADISSKDDVEDAFNRFHEVEVVFNLAGQTAVTTSIANPRADFEVNLLGTLNVLEAMRSRVLNAVLVQASTNKVYGSLASVAVAEEEKRYRFRDFPHGIAEDFPMEFHSPYGCSKGGADQYVLDYARIYGLRTLVMRQSCIYGNHQMGVKDQGWVAWFTIAALLRTPLVIYGNGKQVRDILFVDDLVDAYWKAIDHIGKTKSHAYNIGGGAMQISLIELITRLEAKLGWPVEYSFAAPRPGDQKVFISDHRKATTDFGWTPKTEPDEGLDRLIAWIDDNKALFEKWSISG